MQKTFRNRENVRNVTDEREAAISHYGLFEVAIRFNSSVYSNVFLHSLLSF